MATFNVHHCEGLDGRFDIARIGDVIRRTNADLVALQELDCGMSRSEELDQPAELERLTGMKVTFFPTLERGRGRYGIGVATRSGGGPFELRSLPRLGDEEPRGYTIGPWQGLTLVTTHLSVRAEPRDVQVEALMRLVRNIHGPFLLMGDLNQSAGTLRRAAAGSFRVPWTPRKTLVRRWAQRDHIVGGAGVVVGARDVISTRGSDHNALAAEIEVP